MRIATAIAVLACLSSLGCGLEQLGTRAPQPNVLLIISDDHSWPYFGFMGSKTIQTPSLDRIAQEGVVFTHGYSTASVCRPALNSLLTGLHPIQWERRNEQLERQGVERVAMKEIVYFDTLPELLGRVGYRSFQGGKYWEGTYQEGGFDVGVKSQEKGYAKNVLMGLAGGDGLALGRDSLQPLWDFLDSRGDQPFFVWYAPWLPHKPHDPPDEYRALYEAEGLHYQADAYYGNISWFDAGVGEIIDYLERNDLRKDTLILFISDNGYEQPPFEKVAFRGGAHGKTSIYDYGFRTPILANWQGRIEGGVRSDALVSSVDVFATIVDYAGAALPPDREGRSLRPYLEGGAPPNRERIVVGNFDIQRLPKSVKNARPDLGEKQEAWALRTPRWRYVWFKEAGVEELYEILRDPKETRNVIAHRPELAAAFKAEIQQWLDAMSAPYAN